MSDYTIHDGFNDLDKPLVTVTADSLNSAVTSIEKIDGDAYALAVDFNGTDGPLTVRQLARFLGTFTYITNADGTYPER